MNPLRTAASALLCTFALVSQQAAAVEYALPAANSRLIGEKPGIRGACGQPSAGADCH